MSPVIPALYCLYKKVIIVNFVENDKKKVLGLYFVPAALYCLYNNLSFVSLSYFNPTTYFMFMQTRLLLTGLIYQILFSKKLSSKQWGSLLLLTIGCMIHAGGTAKESQGSTTGITATSWAVIGLGLAFIFTQVLCSVFAGVYNEYLIKGKGADIDIMIQNVFMYLDSIACNVLLLVQRVQQHCDLLDGQQPSRHHAHHQQRRPWHHHQPLPPEAELSTESFCLCVGARHYCSGELAPPWHPPHSQHCDCTCGDMCRCSHLCPEPGVQPDHHKRATRCDEEQDRRKSVKLLNLATSFVNQLFLVTLTRT